MGGKVQMTSEEFAKTREELNAACEALLLSKGRDYTDGKDRLYNFKQLGELLGVSPLQIWAVYTYKHFISIMNYVKTGTVQSEAIEGRFQDLRNYIDLGYGLVQDAKPLEEPFNPEDFKGSNGPTGCGCEFCIGDVSSDHVSKFGG